MSRVYFPSDYLVTATDMNDFESTLASASISIFQLARMESGGYNDSSYTVVGGGVLGKPSEYSSNKNLKFYTQGGDGYIAAGSAIDASGRIITISTAKMVNIGTSDAQFSWTDAGDGTYYAKIEYSGSLGGLKTDDIGAVHYTRETDSYFVTISQSSTVTENQIMLGSCSSLSGVYSSFADKRTYVRPYMIAGAISIDPSLRPVSNLENLQDHVNAIGSGSPTSTNPHALSSDDIGALSKEVATLFTNIEFPTTSPLGVVHQNTSEGTAFVQAQLVLQGGETYNDVLMNSVSLYIGPYGETGEDSPPTGSISQDGRMEIARLGLAATKRTVDYVSLWAPICGLIPAGWYYQFRPTTDINVGSHYNISTIIKVT